MSRPRPIFMLALTLALLLALGACGTSGSEVPQADPSKTPTSSSTAPASSRDQAVADAMKIVTQYNTIEDRVGQDNTFPIGSFRAVSTGADYTTITEVVRRQRAAGWTQTGSVKVTLIKALSVDLVGSSTRPPTVKLATCQDVSDVEGLDKDGKSIVVPGRLDRRLATYTLINDHYADDPHSGWRVSDTLITGEDSCDSV